MLASYLRIAWKVLSRRRFYTAISLAGVSLTPAARPTNSPDSHQRLLCTAHSTASTSSTLICP